LFHNFWSHKSQDMIFGIIFIFSGKTFSKSFSKPDRLNATRTPDLYPVNTHKTDRRAPASDRSHRAAKQDRGVADRRDLADGEVSGQTVTTTMLYGSRRTQWCLERGQRCTEASSSACMAARWLGSLAGACLRPRCGAGSSFRAPGDREGSDVCENGVRGGSGRAWFMERSPPARSAQLQRAIPVRWTLTKASGCEHVLRDGKAKS
jgi:hypothetical protein